MNRELYVVFSSYQPSTAATNHLLAYVKGIAEKGIMVTLFFLYPSVNRDRLTNCVENVRVEYLWDRGISVKSSLLQSIFSSLKLLKNFNESIPVFVSGASRILPILTIRRRIKIYHERTENPESVERSHSFGGNFLFNEYIKSLQKLSGLFVITPSLRQFFIEEYGLDANKVHVINMVVDYERFSNIDSIKPDLSIGYCGTISQDKDGVLYLLKAFAKVQRRYPLWHLKIAGYFCSKDIESQFYSTINNLRIGNVDYVGKITAAEMPQFLASSSILALSRPLQKERAFGFATKIGEYLMTARPIVMTDVGDSSFYLTDQENVIFSKPNDENDFAEKLMWVIEHYDKSKLIGLNGREIVFKSFNYKIESAKLVDVIYKN